MDYSEDEKRAMGMVENYFTMIEGIRFLGRDIPSQDKEEMLSFLTEHQGNSQLIAGLTGWVGKYDKKRVELRTVLEEKMDLEKSLCLLVGRPSFS